MKEFDRTDFWWTIGKAYTVVLLLMAYLVWEWRTMTTGKFLVDTLHLWGWL